MGILDGEGFSVDGGDYLEGRLTMHNEFGYEITITYDSKYLFPIRMDIHNIRMVNELVSLTDGHQIASFQYQDDTTLLFTYDGVTTQNIRHMGRTMSTQQYSFTYAKKLGGDLINYQDSKGNYWDDTMGCINLFGTPMDFMIKEIVPNLRLPLQERPELRDSRVKVEASSEGGGYHNEHNFNILRQEQQNEVTKLLHYDNSTFNFD